MSDRKPQLSELALALNSLSWSEVKSMAVQLKMDYSELEKIEERGIEVSDRLLSAMNMWLKSDANATWARIIKALNDTDKNVLAKEIEQKYCQPVNVPHATTEECSLPSPSPHMHTSDSTEVFSPIIPHTPSSLSQQAPSQLSTDPPISPVSEYSHLTSPPSVSVATPVGGTPISQSKQSPSQPPSSSTLQSSKRKRRNSPTLPISPSPSPSPQPPPPPPQLSTTQPQELPGWQQRVVRETKQEKIRRIREEASDLEIQFVSVVGQAELCFSVRESECKKFLPKFRITLINLPISKKFQHLKFLEDKCEEIESASSVSEIFKLLRQYWKYTDFALLHHLINEFGDDETKKVMKIYTSSLEMFEKQTTIKDFEDATGEKKEVPQGFIEAEIEVQKVRDPSESTLYEVRQKVESLAQQSTLEPYVTMIKEARTGSLVITIALPPPALELLQQALYKEFLDTLNIVSVTIHVWYKTTQVKIFCHKCLKVHVCNCDNLLNCDTVVSITLIL